MARAKEFDRDQVLERAMRLFWSRGYEATSIQDLVEATGINRGSIYGTFADKEGIFLAALEYYLGTIARPMFAELSNPEPRRAIERMLESIVRRNCDRKFPRGCLITNTSLECPAAGERIARVIAEKFHQQEAAIREVLLRAQAEGALAPNRDAHALARFFFGVAHGLNVVNKAGLKPEMLRDIARVAMSVWDDPAVARRHGSRIRRRGAHRAAP